LNAYVLNGMGTRCQDGICTFCTPLSFAAAVEMPVIPSPSEHRISKRLQPTGSSQTPASRPSAQMLTPHTSTLFVSTRRLGLAELAMWHLEIKP